MKKNIYLILFYFLGLMSSIAQNQEMTCTTPVGNLPSPVALDCKIIDESPENLEALKTIVIKVNFHWVENFDGSNFTPDGANGTVNGNIVAQNWVDAANKNILSNLMPNPLAINNQNHLGDAKYRYEIYSDPNNANDIHRGVWYYGKSFKPTKATDFPYKDNVLNVVMMDNGATQLTTSGEAFAKESYVALWRVQSLQYNPSAMYQKWYDFLGALNHEIGHMLGPGDGIDHSFDNNGSLCNSIDINVVAECNSPNPANCDNWHSKSTNMMGYNACQCALSPCQWSGMYLFLSGENSPNWVKKEQDCSFLERNDVVFDNKKSTEWDKVRFLNANIIIKTGSQLVLRCILKLGPGKRIIVERGAKLIVDGGIITRLCEEPWDGIYVHGNVHKEQPNPDTHFSLLQADEAGIVDFSGNSEISWARTVVSTDAPGLAYKDQVERWGGVVRAMGTKFLNNRKVAAFMRYPLKDAPKFYNKSYFEKCEFSKDGTVDIKPDVYAVTIWGTDGIEFRNNNVFNKNFTIHIFGIDCSAVINNNQFEGSNSNIVVENTYPFESDMEIYKNQFTPKGYASTAILSRSGANGVRGINIYNNTFSGNDNNVYQNGIVLDGNTNAFIFGNEFDNVAYRYMIEFTNTGGFVSSIIKCNTFSTDREGTSGITLQGNNPNTQLVGNDFFRHPKGEFKGTNIRLGHITNPFTNGLIQGSIYGVQKWADIKQNPNSNGKKNLRFIDNSLQLPASNIFNLKQNATDYIKASNNDDFTYFTPKDRKNKVYGTEYYPENFNGNFTLDEYKSEPIECSKSGALTGGGDDDFPPNTCDEESIYEIRRKLAALNALSEDPNVKALYYRYWSYLIETIRCIEYNFIEAGNYDDAIRVLLAQPEKDYHRNAFGLTIKKGDYDAASQLLQKLSTEDIDDQWFVKIQEINLRRFQSEIPYVLNNEEETFLTEVANSKSKERSYARALLDLLDGYREYPNDAQEQGQYRNMKEYTSATLQQNTRKETIFVSPNPIEGDEFQINTKNIKVERGTVQLRDMFGNVVLSKKFSAAPYERNTIDCSSLMPGLYAVLILDGELPLFEGKISILR